MGIFQESLNSYFTILLITLVALSSCFSSTIALNSVIAQPTTTASSSQFTAAKESSIMLLLNNVKRYLPDASIVVGIITPNGTQVYGYGKYI